MKNELSLRKRKYAELFFDFERKVFKHTRIMIVLRSIVRNKTRKERLGIVLIFRKVFCNTQKMLLCSNYAEGALADFSQQNMGLQVRKSNLPLSIAKDLKLNSAASSFILN